MATTYHAAVMAAGKGTRMRSETIKVLHPMLGRALLDWVIEGALEVGVRGVTVIVGHDADRVREHLTRRQRDQVAIDSVEQREQLGTGHALWSAREAIARSGATHTLVLSGDVPNLSASSLERFMSDAAESQSAVALITAELDEPGGYGRIVRGGEDKRHVEAIVEAADATPEQLAIAEINAGVYVLRNDFALEALEALCSGVADNAQGEFYLTDLIAMASDRGLGVFGWPIDEVEQTHGVNTRHDLARATALARRLLVDRWMARGVTMHDPERVVIGPEVQLEPDVTLYEGVHLEGTTRVERGTTIEPGGFLRDAQIGPYCHIKAHSYIDAARLERGAVVGPFVHLRPGADLGPQVKVGNFVEIKKTRLDEGAKASHLTYLGDAHVGAGANIGAGTITCNYDGVSKHRTEIGPGAFVGSNSALVAPIRIGQDAFVAAGSTLTHDVPEGALGVARGRQRTIEGWAQRKKKS